METSSSSAQNRQLADWYNNIKTGKIKLPRFQRMEAWDRHRVESFLNTVIHNLPVGVTLILNVGDQEKFISRYINTAEPENNEKVGEHLLDGQQRLTSFWRALHNNYEHETYFVYFPEFERYYEQPWSDETIIYCRTRYLKNDQRYPLWADSPKECLLRGCVPMELFRPENVQSEIDRWIDQATKYIEPTEDDPNALVKFKEYTKFQKDLTLRITELRETIAHFNLPFLSLPASTPKEIALQVFINMNTNSKPLSIYDIIVAEVENEMKTSLHDLQKQLNNKFPKVQEYFELDFLILATSALLQDKLPNHRGMAEMDKSKLVQNWDTLEKGLYRMAEFMESQGVFDKQRLPTNAVLSVIAAVFSYIPETGDLAGQGDVLLKKYLWSSFFTYRYENSAASRAFMDYVGLKNVMLKTVKEETGEIYSEKDIPVLNRNLYPLIDKDELVTVGWAKKVNIRARGILAISTYLTAQDFADGQRITRDNIKKREYHHIFPDALLKEAGISNTLLALNCALITGSTNRTIGRKDPLTYLKERYKWMDESIVNDRLNSHLIPIVELANGGYEGLEEDARINKIKLDFANFLDARAELILIAIDQLTQGKSITIDSIIKKSIDLPPAMQNLFNEVERIEIGLRELINTKLESTENAFDEYVPEIVRLRTDQKISSYLKKFPNESIEEFAPFRRRIDFLTLGELKDIIVNKRCWDEFEPIFGSKQNIDMRFNQLFTLRNQIAHNNELNDIMIKDGEASILWLKGVISKNTTINQA